MKDRAKIPFNPIGNTFAQAATGENLHDFPPKSNDRRLSGRPDAALHSDTPAAGPRGLDATSTTWPPHVEDQFA